MRSSGYQNKVEQPYRSSADIDKHRHRHASPPPLGVHGGGRGGGRQEYSGVRRPASPQTSDWYHHQRGGSYDNRTPTKSGSDRRLRPSAVVHSDVYRREAESRHHKSPPPHRRQHGEYLHDEDPYMRPRHRSHQRNFSPPPRQHWAGIPPSPPPPPPPHRHTSPPARERRVVSRRSPPPPPPPHRPHLPRDQFGEHLHHSRTTYQSPPSRHRRIALSPPPPPPISASRSRRPNPHPPERERERGRGRPREEEPRRPARRDEGPGRNADWTRQRSPEPRDTRRGGDGGAKRVRDRDRYPSDENSLRLHKEKRNHRSDSGETDPRGGSSNSKKSPSRHAQKENEKSSSKRLQSVLSVLDSVRVR